MDADHLNPVQPNSRGDWIALVIGNSRLHWAWFHDDQIQSTWDTAHAPEDLDASVTGVWQRWLTPPQGIAEPVQQPPELRMASVVPHQTRLWQTYPNGRVLTLADVPLHRLYPTLGIDRAIALLGAVHSVGAPALVIDAGTALTFTGVDPGHQLVGGAIMPGLRLQLRSLSSHTAALPLVEQFLASSTVPRWACQTDEAILSGVMYSLVAGVESFIRAWFQQFPRSPVVMTGGDGTWLFEQLQAIDLGQGATLRVDPHLIFRGMAAILR